MVSDAVDQPKLQKNSVSFTRKKVLSYVPQLQLSAALLWMSAPVPACEGSLGDAREASILPIELRPLVVPILLELFRGPGVRLIATS